MTRRSARVAVHTLFSLVVTWPLVSWMGVALPNGTEDPGTVAYFNLWTLRWNQQQLGDLYRHYWDAPIFHPEPGAFALSEPQPLTGLVFTPISWITGNPTLAYNIILLAALTLNGIAAARLGRRLGASPMPAMLIGLLAQVLPFVHNELGVEQLAMVFPTLFLADAILAWAEEETWPRGLAIGAWLSATFLTCGYYGLFALVVVGPATLVLVRREWFSRRRLLQLGAAAALFAVVCGPILLAQNRYTSPYSRPDRVILGNSAEPRAWLTLYEELRGAKLTPWLSTEAGGERLYPGTVAIGLAIAGAVLIVEGPIRGRRRYRQAAFFGVGILSAFLLSLGLRLSVFGWLPYTLVRDFAPGWKDLRSPFRTAVLVQAFLLPVAAVALDRLWHLGRVPADPAVTADAPAEPPTEPPSTELPAPTGEPLSVDPPPSTEPPTGAAEPEPSRVPGWWRPWMSIVLCVALIGIGLFEIWPGGQQLVEVPTDMGQGTDWVDWLAADRDPGAGDGSVAMYPFPADGGYISYEPTTVWMLASLEHHRPLVNGYSGLFPSSYDNLEQAMRAGFPGDLSVSRLSAARVSFVVVPRDWAEGDAAAQLAAYRSVLRPVFTGQDMVILALAPPSG